MSHLSKKIYGLLIALLLGVAAHQSNAANQPFGDAKAPRGGSFTVGFPDYPKHLLYYLAFDELAAGVNGLVFDTLMETHPDSNDLIPLLAERWETSKDKKVFSVYLNAAAKFSDGKPVTAEDVKFTFDTLTDKKNKTVPFQSAYQSLESCTVKGPLLVEFRARDVHFKNLEKIAALFILPKHIYSKGDFNKAFHSTLVGSGPYTLEEAKQGEKIRLKRVPSYWAQSLFQNVGRYNFETINFKAVPEYSVQFEMFKRGDIDYFYFLSSKMWATETDGPLFSKNYIQKLKMTNKIPFGTQGIAWNIRKPLFQDVRVRKALAHLFNRERMIKDLFYSNYESATGVVNRRSEFASAKIKPLPYDPEAAKKLLREAGWTAADKEGVLTKDGQRFDFEFLTNNSAGMRYLTIYQEDLKKVGIAMRLRNVDWATSIKLVDDRQFEATDIARGRDIDPSDFIASWGEKEADQKGSANLTGFKNPELDRLDKQLGETFEKKKRIPLVQKINELIVDSHVLAFAWEPSYTRLAYWNRFGMPNKRYTNYATWSTVFTYWWFDEKKETALKAAMASGAALP